MIDIPAHLRIRKNLWYSRLHRLVLPLMQWNSPSRIHSQLCSPMPHHIADFVYRLYLVQGTLEYFSVHYEQMTLGAYGQHLVVNFLVKVSHPTDIGRAVFKDKFLVIFYRFRIVAVCDNDAFPYAVLCFLVLNHVFFVDDTEEVFSIEKTEPGFLVRDHTSPFTGFGTTSFHIVLTSVFFVFFAHSLSELGHWRHRPRCLAVAGDDIAISVPIITIAQPFPVQVKVVPYKLPRV